MVYFFYYCVFFNIFFLFTNNSENKNNNGSNSNFGFGDGFEYSSYYDMSAGSLNYFFEKYKKIYKNKNKNDFLK